MPPAPIQPALAIRQRMLGAAYDLIVATGYEQVRSIAASLAGDRAAADLVELDLPETGVCSIDLGGSCDLPAAGEPTAS